MANFELVTAADVPLMQGLAQRVTAIRPDLISAGASYGELAWIWGKEHAAYEATWRRRLWFSGADLVAWAWAFLPRPLRRGDGSVQNVTHANLTYQVHPGHFGLVDEVIDWYDGVAAGLERAVVPCAGDEFALRRWAAHGYQTPHASLGDTGDWTQLNERDLIDVEEPALPDGYRFRTADEAGPKAAVQAHIDAWDPSTYSADAYEGVRQTAAYRGDLHILVEAPDGTMASSTITWLDEANKTAEFEPVGTHPDYRRRGLARATMLHGMQRARAAGATHVTVVCLGAPGHPAARGLYYGLGFRELSRDAPLIKCPVSASEIGGMGNWRTFPLRIIKASWGIAVDIRARWELASDVSDEEIRVSPRVYLKMTATGIMSSDVEYIVHGIGRMASALEAKAPSELLVIEVDQLKYSPADYQPEGAEIAIICWISEEFGIASPIKGVVYNKEKNEYIVSYIS
jgi:GNAT superfamily N-acetyltransferase